MFQKKKNYFESDYFYHCFIFQWKKYEENSLVTSASNLLNDALSVLRLNLNNTRQLPPSVASVIPNSRAAFPLGFGLSVRYVGPGVALIG